MTGPPGLPVPTRTPSPAIGGSNADVTLTENFDILCSPSLIVEASHDRERALPTRATTPFDTGIKPEHGEE